MNRHCKFAVLTTVFFITGAFLLYIPNVAGLADNTDFIRITQPVGMVPDKNLKFFYFQRRFEYIKSFDNLGDFLRFVINPGIKNESGFKSTQFIFVKTAQVLGGVIQYLKHNSIGHFDIVALSAVFLMLHAFSAALLFRTLKTGKPVPDLVILLMLVIILFNTGYLLYYNSLFGESVSLSGFLLWFSVLLSLAHSGEKKYPMLILYFASAIVFTGAKVSNIPLGFSMAVFSVYFLMHTERAAKKAVVIAGICLLLASAVYFYMAIPDWMEKTNNFHSVFFGILKNSENPEKDLQELGIDTKYSVLAGINAYADLKGFDIFSEEFQKEVHDKTGPFRVTLYYLKHPGRMLEKLNLSAEASVFIRPPYLGNYSPEDYTEILKFARRNSVWELIRKKFTGYALYALTAVFLLYLAITFYQIYLVKNQKYSLSPGYIPVKILLVIFAVSQWVFPVIGNGEADLIKHMFMFNLLLDTMIILLVTDIIKLALGKLLNPRIIISLSGLVIVTVILVIADKKIPDNDLIVFGGYRGKPLAWEVVEETDNYLFVVSKDVVDFRPFSSENNFWPESDIRKWLNDDSENGFLHEFSDDEKDRICSSERITLISPAFADLKESGFRPHYWFCIPGYVSQNYHEAYQVKNAEKVFLLSIYEWESYDFSRNKGVPYWLRTPYMLDMTVRIAGEDGYVYHKKADTENIGVLPAMIIKK